MKKIVKPLWSVFIILAIIAGIVWVGGHLWRKVKPIEV